MGTDAAPETATPSAPDPDTTLGIGHALSRAGLYAWSAVGILAVLWALVWLLGRTRVLLAPVVLAVALVYILNPVVGRLALLHIPRVIGALLGYIGLLGAIVLVGFLVAPSISDQASSLSSDFPQIYQDSVREIEDLVADLGLGEVDLWTYEQLQEFIHDPERQDQVLSTVLDNIGRVTSGLLEAVLVFFVAPVVAFYVLIDLPRVRKETISLIPEHLQDEVTHVSRQLGGAVGGFIRGQVLVALIVGVLTSFGFWLIDLRFWLIIGMIAGFLNIIPFVGPWVGGTLGVLVGLATGSVSTALLAGLVALIVQQVDNNFVSPTVLRATVRLHPAVVILVLILGGAVGGLWGVLLAVPVTAGVKILVGHVWRTRVLGQSWQEASDAATEQREPSLASLRKNAEEPEAAPAGAGEQADTASGEPDQPPESFPES